MKTFICLIVRGVVFLTFSLAPTFAQPSEPPGLAHRPAVLTNNVHYRRWAWAHERRKYPAQSIPTGALLRAWEETARIDAEQTLTEPAVLPGNAWVPVGPAPILNGQTSGSQPVSGRIADLAIDPTDNAHWLAGGAQGGLWESRNAGLTWRPMTDNQASLSMGAVAFAPSDPSILFVGTGEQNIAADAYAGVGILKSTNGGTNWSLLGTANFGGAKFSEIKVHPTNPNLVLAAADSGVWKSTNGGTSWVLKRSGYASDLEPDPTSFTNLYCALGSAFGGGNNGVYRSTDLGETWSAVSGPWSTAAGGVGRIELAIAPSARGTLYVSIQDALDGSANDGRSLGLWRTDDAWNVAPSWTQLPAIATSSQLWYDHDVVVDPTNPNILYFGETNMRRFDGVAWVNITGTIHVDVQALAWAGNRLVLGSDGGVWSTTTGGASWSDHNTNLQLTQFYRGALSPNDPNFALGGSQDNGTARWFGTNGWRLVFGGDGAGCAIANATNWAVSFQGQEIRRTRNNGLSFEDANGGLVGNAPFIGHLRKAPHHDDIFLASLSVLNKCTNFFSGAAAAWSANAPDLGNSVTEFAFARSDASDRTYAYSAASQLRLTTDGGQTWKDLDPFGQVPARTVTGLAFNPTDANILYVCLSGFNENTPALPGHVFRTANALAASPTWAAATFPVNIPANAIAMDQSDPAVVYVGTDLGVWRTLNGGDSWLHMGPESGMPNVAVFDLALENNTRRMLAFTHGRGAFSLIQANSADLALAQRESADPSSLGCAITYTLDLVNRGPADAVNVTVTNQLPAGAAFISANVSQGTVTHGVSTLAFVLGTLPVSSNATLTVTVFPGEAGTFTNAARAQADQTDPDASNNAVSESTTVVLDTGGPTVASAVAQAAGDGILVTFNEAVAPETATNAANYALIDGRSNAVAFSRVELGPVQGTVMVSASLLAAPGPYVLSIDHLSDCAGNVMASNTVAYVIQPRFLLIPSGSAWKYLDDGLDQGTVWRAPAFDDSSWNEGEAQLGYGDGDEKTVLDFGPNAAAKYPTYYFRRSFFVLDPTLLSGLIVSLLRDDGGVVYLNGTEVFRSNMPGGAIGYGTFASTAVTGADEQSSFSSTNINSSLLVAGVNVIAVEIHQNNGTSSDISFDLALAANLRMVGNPASFLKQPEGVTALVGDTVTLSILPGGTPPFGFQWRRGASIVVNFPGAPTLTLPHVQLGDAGVYSCVISNLFSLGLRSTLVPVTVLVDSDGDRLPDVWELTYGLSPTNAEDASLDLDRDGQSNLQEYLAGTDPSDPHSVLKIDEITSAPTARLRFFAASNHTYSLQYRSSLSFGSWSNLVNIPYQPSNRIETIVDPGPPAVQRYYRLVAPRQPQ